MRARYRVAAVVGLTALLGSLLAVVMLSLRTNVVTGRATDIAAVSDFPSWLRRIRFAGDVDHAVVTGSRGRTICVAGSISQPSFDEFVRAQAVTTSHWYPEVTPVIDRRLADLGLDTKVFGFHCDTEYFSFSGLLPAAPQTDCTFYYCPKSHRIVIVSSDNWH